MAAVNPPAQWVTDQVLDPLADVDRFVEATNKDATYVPESTAGGGVDTVSGYAATDTVKATKTKK